MDAFTSSVIGEIAGNLATAMLNAAGRKFRESVRGTKKEQAINRCLNTALVALLTRATTQVTEEVDLLDSIFRNFFKEQDVATELAALLRGQPLNRDELVYLFEHAGYQAATLPGLKFNDALSAFEAAFIAAAIAEPELQGTIQTQQLMTLTKIGSELLELMKGLVQFLQQSRYEDLKVQQGKILAPNKTTNVISIYQIQSIHDIFSADWESHYLRTLISRYDPLDLAPIDETYFQSTSPKDENIVRITDVFTTLYLKGLSRTSRQSVKSIIFHPIERSEPKAEKDKLIPIQATEAVAAVDRLVILGQPGSGKSTLVNHITTQLARRRLGKRAADEKLPGWDSGYAPLPVLIILRRFAAWLPEKTPHDKAGLVWDYLAHQLQQLGCKEAFLPLKQKLIDEGGIIFFDGLDEVSETDEAKKRTLIREAIVAFAEPLEHCQVIVTCREYAYKEADRWCLPKKQFPVVELALFNLDQIRQFAQTWYQVVGPQKGWDPVKCQAEADNLFRAIQERPHLQELAQYPLLLTLMAQVHGRVGYLPQDRADLYEKAVNLLLAYWENRIVRDVVAEPKTDQGLILRLGVRTEVLRSALERVAFAAHERQEQEKGRSELAADIPKADLLEELRAGLGSLDKAELVISYIQERAGLLQARDNFTYTFPHRTFQEYLTATHIKKQAEFDTMLRDRVRRDLPWWQEVFLLAAGSSRTTPRNISDMVDCLLPQPPEPQAITAERASFAILAGQTLFETNFAEHQRKEAAIEPGRYTETFHRIQNWLKIVLAADHHVQPKIRAAAGDALARLGDPRPEVMTLTDMQFCFVPKGPFWMGSDEYADEKPFHQNDSISYDYWISRYPITNAQFHFFVEAKDRYINKEWWTKAGLKWRGQRTAPDKFGGVFDLPNHPVVYVSWYEALAFTRWLTAKLQQEKILPKDWQIRLPSEAEWEKAARGGIQVPDQPLIQSLKNLSFRRTDSIPQMSDRISSAKRRYPWGYQPDPNLANYDDTGIGTTSAVGCFPGGKSPYGCEEMSGNVWEWCSTIWREDYRQPADDRLEGERARVLRGGAFYNDLRNVRCALRHRLIPHLRSNHVGFRVVLSPCNISLKL